MFAPDILLEPGMIVVYPEQTSWEPSQIQPIIGDQITVNFAHTGKFVIDGGRVFLEPLPICGGN